MIGAALALAATLLSQAAPVRFPVGSRPEVRIETLEGRVEVTASDTDEVELRSWLSPGPRGAGKAWRIDARQAGDALRVRLCCGTCDAPRGACGPTASARLKLTVPEATRLKVSATSAQVSLVGVRGKVKVETIAGGITAEGSTDELELATVSGDIATGPQKLAATRITTEGGNVQLKLPTEAGARIRFITVSGTLDGKPPGMGTHDQQIGIGGPTVEVQTVDGSLRVDRTNADRGGKPPPKPAAAPPGDAGKPARPPVQSSPDTDGE